MRVIGLDPGLARTGYGVVDGSGSELILVQYGVITTDAGEALSTRLYKLHQQLDKLLVSFSPQIAVVEQLFFGNNSRTAIAVGQARGVILLALEANHLPIAEYTPMQIKQAITGYGQADKIQMQRMVSMLLGLEQVVCPDDAADALAAAICYHHSTRWENLAAEQGE